jgi:hypothetical protein
MELSKGLRRIPIKTKLQRYLLNGGQWNLKVLPVVHCLLSRCNDIC